MCVGNANLAFSGDGILKHAKNRMYDVYTTIEARAQCTQILCMVHTYGNILFVISSI